MTKVTQRTISPGEILENQRRASQNRPTNTITRSVKLGSLWYKIWQEVKR